MVRRITSPLVVLLLALAVCAWCSPLYAEEAAPAPLTVEKVQESLDSKSMDLDTVWTLIAGFLVMWMQAGFAAVETGFTRAKNAVNISMKNLLDFSFGSLAFWAVGFGLMFSIGSGAMENYVGDSGFFLSEEAVELPQDDGTKKKTTNFDPISWTKVPLETKFFFQLVFAATAATIVSGAMAERTKFTSYMIYSLFITALIYPISGHWIWGGGWLADMGFWDFAGSTVVHSVGGWLALVGAFILGPRIGKYGEDGKPRAIPGHNIPIATLGVFILWLGWFGFNPGSTMGAVRNDISHIVVTTNIAAAAGVIASLFTAKILLGNWDSGMALNGALAGLVAITAPCFYVTAPAAVIIGLTAGVLVVLAIQFFDRIVKIDDPVGAISVHGVCGAFGTLAVGLFANPTAIGYSAGPEAGLFVGGSMKQFMIQLTGVGAVFAWCIVTGTVLFLMIKLVFGLRVTAAEEIEGLDVGEHDNEAYFGFVFAKETLTGTVQPPRPALMPPDGKNRFTLVVEGAETAPLAQVWSDLCQSGNGPPPEEFKLIYPYFTTVSGNRFRFRGGDTLKVKDTIERLLKDRLRSSALHVKVEE